MGQRVVAVALGIEPGGLQRPLEVIEDRDHAPSHLGLAAQRRGLNLRRHPLAVVLEVGLSPASDVEVLVPFRFGVSQELGEVLLTTSPRCARRLRPQLEDGLSLGTGRVVGCSSA